MDDDPPSGKPDFAILLVEDDDNDALLLRRALERSAPAAVVRWVRNGLEALFYLKGDGEFSDRRKHPFPNAIFMDLKMPQMSGFELLAWLQDNPQLVSIPTIVISGSPLARDVEKARLLGANTYLVNPLISTDWRTW